MATPVKLEINIHTDICMDIDEINIHTHVYSHAEIFTYHRTSLLPASQYWVCSGEGL